EVEGDGLVADGDAVAVAGDVHGTGLVGVHHVAVVVDGKGAGGGGHDRPGGAEGHLVVAVAVDDHGAGGAAADDVEGLVVGVGGVLDLGDGPGADQVVNGPFPGPHLVSAAGGDAEAEGQEEGGGGFQGARSGHWCSFGVGGAPPAGAGGQGSGPGAGPLHKDAGTYGNVAGGAVRWVTIA